MSTDSTSPDQHGREHQWRRLARRTALRLNAAWLLDRLNPWLLGAALVASVALLCLRTVAPFVREDRVLFLGMGAALLLAVLVVGWIFARRRFVGEDEALVRLEDWLELDNALSSARAGVGDWPELPDSAKLASAGYAWRAPQAVLPAALASALLAAALWIPVPRFQAAVAPPAHEPTSWEQMDQWLGTVEEQEVVEEEAIEEYREGLAELRDQPEEDWFGHGSLEASDSLRESLRRDMEGLAMDLGATARNLEALEHHAAELSQTGREQLIREYEEALASLEGGGLPLDETLRKQLAGLDPEQLAQGRIGQLSPEQMEALRESLGQACQGIGSLEGFGEGEGEGQGETLAALLERLGRKPGTGPGRGGIARGRGDAPLHYGDKSEAEGGKLEHLPEGDKSELLPGDLVGSGESEHEEPSSEKGGRQGGAVSSAGRGGEAVWRDELMPAEREVLKRFFGGSGEG